MATFAALGFAYADVLRQPYAQLTPTRKILRLTICVQVLQKQRKMSSETLGEAQAGFRLRQPYANLTPSLRRPLKRKVWTPSSAAPYKN